MRWRTKSLELVTSIISTPNRCGWTATLSAVRLEDLFKIPQLGGWNQLRERELTGASRQGHLDGVEGLPGRYLSTLVDAGTAFDRQD